MCQFRASWLVGQLAFQDVNRQDTEEDHLPGSEWQGVEAKRAWVGVRSLRGATRAGQGNIRLSAGTGLSLLSIASRRFVLRQPRRVQLHGRMHARAAPWTNHLSNFREPLGRTSAANEIPGQALLGLRRGMMTAITAEVPWC